MERIFYGTVFAPTSIAEFVEFNRDRPYTISVKQFEDDDIVIPHYADSIEILLCDNLTGSVTIDASWYALRGRQVFVIPQKAIHSLIIRKNPGSMVVLKISLSALSEFLSIENILRYKNLSLHAPFVCDEFDELFESVSFLIKQDEDVFCRLVGILEVFQKLSRYFDTPDEKTAEKTGGSHALKRLLDWTTTNCGSNITIEQAAEQAGYSRYYFCRWFKKTSGMTYHEYLNHVRIRYACTLLMQNKTVSEVTGMCGYENISFFIRLFTRLRHCTPKQYVQKYKNS